MNEGNLRGELGMDFSVDIIFRIAIIGIVVAIVELVLKKAGKDDLAMMATLAGIIVVLVLVINMINDFFTAVKTLFQL